MMGRRLALVGPFVAIAAGVAVVVLSGQLYASAAARVPDRFAAAPIVVTSPSVSTPADPFPATRPWSSAGATALAERIRALPGVTAVVVDRSFYAQVVFDGRVVPTPAEASGWSSAALGVAALVSGRPPGLGEVVLSRSFGVRVGDEVTLLTATGPGPYRVAGLVDRSVLFVDDDTAARWSPGVRDLGVLTDATVTGLAATVEAVRRTVGPDGQVLTGGQRFNLEPRSDATIRWIGSQVLAGMGALAAFATVFVVASTFTLSVAQRRRELALLRLIGATPAQVRWRLYREALTVGGLSGLVGAGVGAVLAPVVGGVLVSAGFEPLGYAVRLSLWPFAAALALGLVVALLGVWSAARRAGRLRPLAALRESTVEEKVMGRLRWWAGGAFAAMGGVAAAGAALSTDAEDTATFSLFATMALVVAASALAPAVVPPVIRFVSWPFSSRRGPVIMLARQSALTAVRRTAGTAAPVLLTVAFAVLVTGTVQTTAASYTASRAAGVRAGSVLAPAGTPGLSDAAVAVLGPASASLLWTDVYRDGTVLAAVGVVPAAFVATSGRLTVVGGDLTAWGEGDLVVTRSTADQYGWHVGERVRFGLADGSVANLPIIAVVAGKSAPPPVMLSRAYVQAHDPSALSSAVFEPGPAPAMRVLGGEFIDVATYAARVEAADDRLVWLFTVLLVAVSAGYGAIAVAATLLMSAMSRRRDFRLLYRSGATRAQVGLAVAAESAAVVLIGALLGTVAALIALWGGLAALRERAAAAVPLVVPWELIGAVIAGCLVLAVTASVIPAVRATAQPVRARPSARLGNAHVWARKARMWSGKAGA